MGTHQHPVSARFVGGLDHQLVQVLEHVCELRLVPADVGGHIGKDRVFTGVIPDHFRDVGIDDLVVPDPGAGGIGHGHPPFFINFHDPGNAQHGIRTEGPRIDEIVVDPAIEHIDPHGPLGGAHEYAIVGDHQVPALHQIDSHLPGQEGVFEVGGVVYARGENRHFRGADGIRCDEFEHFKQPVGIILHRADGGGLEHLGECAFQHLTVFQDIGYAGWTAQVVLQDIEPAVGITHQVGAGNVAPYAPGGPEALALCAVGPAGKNQVFRNHPVLDDFTIVVNIVDKLVDGVDTLPEPGFDVLPLIGLDDTGKNIEGKDPFGTAFVAVNGESDAHLHQGRFRRPLQGEQRTFGQGFDALHQQFGSVAGGAGCGEKLVIEPAGIVI